MACTPNKARDISGRIFLVHVMKLCPGVCAGLNSRGCAKEELCLFLREHQHSNRRQRKGFVRPLPGHLSFKPVFLPQGLLGFMRPQRKQMICAHLSGSLHIHSQPYLWSQELLKDLHVQKVALNWCLCVNKFLPPLKSWKSSILGSVGLFSEDRG